MLKNYLVSLQFGKTMHKPSQRDQQWLAEQIAPLFEKAQALGKLYASKQLERALFATIGGWIQRAVDLVGRAVDWAISLFEARVEDLGDDTSEDDWEEAASLVADTVAEALSPTEIQSIIEETVLSELKSANVEQVVILNEPGACQECKSEAAKGSQPIDQVKRPPIHNRCRCHVEPA